MQIVIDISDKAYDYAKTQMALFLDVNKEILDAVKNGTVVSERPKGEWKSDGHGHIYCTACNQTNVSMWKSPFCPSCGADMRGGKE